MRAGALGGVLVIALAAVVPAVRGDDMPQFPDQQQAVLRETEDQVVKLHKRLFAARQQQDEATVSALTKELKTVQDKRRALIAVTKDQLSSD